MKLNETKFLLVEVVSGSSIMKYDSFKISNSLSRVK